MVWPGIELLAVVEVVVAIAVVLEVLDAGCLQLTANANSADANIIAANRFKQYRFIIVLIINWNPLSKIH